MKTLSVTLTDDDIEDLVSSLSPPPAREASRRVSPAALVLAGFALLALEHSGVLGEGFGSARYVGWAVIVGAVLFATRGRAEPPRQADDSPLHYSIDHDEVGVHVVADGSEEVIPWAGISEIVDDARYILIVEDADNIVVVPKRAFEGDGHATEFYEQVHRHHLRAVYGGALD